MFKVEETPKIEANIKKHKKMFETYQLFTFGLKIEDTIYYNVVYNPWFSKKPSAGLILTSNGDIPSFQEARKPLWLFNIYNTSIATVINSLLKDQNVPLDAHEKLLKLLQEFSMLNTSITNEQKQAIDRLINNLSQYIAERKQLFDIKENIKDIQNTVMKDRGFIYPDEARAVEELIGDYFGVMYRGGKIIEDDVEGYKEILNVINNNKDQFTGNDQSIAKQLKGEIKAFISHSALSSLRNSQSTFEKDKHGNKAEFSSGEEGIGEMIRAWRDRGKYEFEQKMLPHQRNPKSVLNK